MTTYYKDQQACCVCGASNTCRLLGSTNTFGSPDLDLRPPEMQRSTMDAWLQECEACGYVNGELTEAIPSAKAILETDAYQALRVETDRPELANRFARYALLQQADPEAAGVALLRAAWACDDAKQPAAATSFRNQSADLLLGLQPFGDDEEQTTLAVILVDILRRAQRFEEAQTLARTLLARETPVDNETIVAVLEYQAQLCEYADASAKTVSDCV